MRVISIRLPEQIIKELQEIASTHNKSVSEIIRLFIIEGENQYQNLRKFSRWQIKRKKIVTKMLHGIMPRFCEKCKTTKGKIILLHLNGDVEDFSPQNIVFLCERCAREFSKFRAKNYLFRTFLNWFFSKQNP